MTFADFYNRLDAGLFGVLPFGMKPSLDAPADYWASITPQIVYTGGRNQGAYDAGHTSGQNYTPPVNDVFSDLGSGLKGFFGGVSTTAIIILILGAVYLFKK